MMRCPRGEMFDSHDPERSYVHRQHYAEHKPVKFAEPRPFTDPEAAARKIAEAFLAGADGVIRLGVQ
jgi:hypothetical protein